MNERLWKILVDSFPKLLEYGVKVTVPLTALSFALALVIAVIVAMIQYANVRLLRQVCRFYIWIVRGTPLLVQLYLVFYGLPSLGVTLPAYPTAVLVFGFNEGAYMAESMRGALESVSRGQMEAGWCVGLNYLQIMRHIVLPQAFRAAFPALSNSLISMLKGTSLAATITVTEMFREATIINGRVYESLGLYTEVALIYLAFCTILTWLQRLGERKLASYGGDRA
ncbi:MAG: amino acid ABC transporter permease [Clostridia bacterium]|nr:amino acid ABC transporter permease [Clostridia bacterium]MBR3273141.1 amino acid ABC transporter permease [Clostridia bacterium]